MSALNMVREKVSAMSVKPRTSTAIRWSGLSTRAPACREEIVKKCIFGQCENHAFQKVR